MMELRIPMQPPTVRAFPWLPWDVHGMNSEILDRYQRRRLRLSLHDLAELRNTHDATGRGLTEWWNQMPRKDISLYVPKNLRHLIRLDTTPSRRSNAFQSGPWPPPPPGPTTRPAKTFSIFGGDNWDLPDLRTSMNEIPQIPHLRLEPIPMAPAGRELERPYRNTWEGATRAWAAGLLILVVIVIFVRAVEKCIHRKLYKTRRRQSEEWPTPNVLATSHRHVNDLDLLSTPRMEDSDVFTLEGNQDSISNDLPPPYSECANVEANSDANKYLGPEEPPPPYSACYVAYSNPKDGVPSVHFLNRQREDIFRNRLEAGHSSSMPDVLSYRDTDNAAKETDGCDNAKTELVFENGRVIEREEVTVNSGNTQDSTRNGDYIVNVSELGSVDVPDSSSLQV